MKIDTQKQTVFSRRLKDARLNAGLTQMQLGVMAGIDEFSASARINQYERAVHAPDYGTAERIAKALKVPVGYLYEADDKLAEIIVLIGRLSKTDRDELMAVVQAINR